MRLEIRVPFGVLDLPIEILRALSAASMHKNELPERPQILLDLSR